MLKRHVVIKAKRINPKINIKIDYKTLVFFTLMVCGVILGVFISEKGSDEWHRFFTTVIKSYLHFEESKSILAIFSRIFLPFFTLYLITYLVGMCGMGVPFLTIIPLILGGYFGVEITQYYINFGLSGIGCCALIYAPIYAIATATLIKCCCQAFDISKEIFFYSITGKGDGKPIFKEYSLKHLFFLVPIIIGAGISTLFYTLFGDLFSFI